MKQTTIFKQLILNIILPVVSALVILAILNYTQTRTILVDNNQKINKYLADEITNVLAFQDESLRLIEERLNERLENFSDILVYDHFRNTDKIVNADLYKIRDKLGMATDLEDIYVIDIKTGVIVNTTFAKDSGVNAFQFGAKFEEFLKSVASSDTLVSERISIEQTTKRLKKYTYQPTLDHNYIIEIGMYSDEAERIVGFVKNRLNSLSKKDESILAVDLFIEADNPFAMNTGETLANEDVHKELLLNVFATKNDLEYKDKEQANLLYNYIYTKRENSILYKSAVVRILSDSSRQDQVLSKELTKHILIFGLTLITVILLIYRKTKVITFPIKKLVDNVIRITGGQFTERAEVMGNNEITKLSQQFNKMIATIEDYYNELEQKVRERTAEIMSQKEEIESQRDAIEEQRDSLADKNRSIQLAYEEIDRQNRNITDSIQYASRIQNAILPSSDYVKKLLPNSFIFLKPKDIVSGDFYWLAETEDSIIVSAVDCTGHGVPGAFMSIVGNNMLNNAVNIHDVKSANQILDSLNKGVTGVLGQSKFASKTAVRDGMDLALCTINKKKKTLEYAGAYNPLFRIRNNELEVIKADKHPIGNFIEDKLIPFTGHSINYEPGDTFYIFSDGYVDQFGGPKDRKFMSTRFKELLLSIQEQTMEEQLETLETTLHKWKGHYPQVDDVLVIGFRL